MSADEPVRLEVTAGRLEQLISSGAIRASDFRCLDKQSKSIVWWLLLHSIL